MVQSDLQPTTMFQRFAVPVFTCTLLMILGSGAQMHGPVFLMEPPSRLAFSNTSGARAACAAHGQPPPRVRWLLHDNSPADDVPGLRHVMLNGTLVLLPFTALQFRADVHTATYRCRAENIVGSVISRDVRVNAVMDVLWEPSVTGAHALSGGAAALQCIVPASVRDHITVTAWYKDDAMLLPIPVQTEGRYAVAGARGDVLVVRGARRDDHSAYACVTMHTLTGERKRSEPVGLQVTDPVGSMAPRLVTASSDEVVEEGAEIRLACSAIGHPQPIYSWYRSDSASGQLVSVSSGARVSVAGEVVVVRRAARSDAGRWSCRAHNHYGDAQRDIVLDVRAPLLVHVYPQMQVANSGSTAVFNCSVSGGSGGSSSATVTWLHDGARVGVGVGSTLVLRGVARAHRGMYQCRAQDINGDTAQATAELRLGDTAPELQYTFIEQALRPGGTVALRCAASGAPTPKFTWLLDHQPVVDLPPTQRYAINQYVTSSGDVVSHLNVSMSRADDGGRYTCRAENAVGRAEHSARLNIYGSPSIRSLGPIRVVAGSNTTIYCPYSGFPIRSVRWWIRGQEISSSALEAVASSARLSVSAAGELLLAPAEPTDAGAYSCSVTAPSGEQVSRDLQIIVKNPPVLAPFFFPPELKEGSSVQLLCGLTSGDRPVYFAWFKDGAPIAPSLQIQEKSLDEFSFLIFSHVTSKHSGDYTCTASNAAAEVNHTARLTVKVSPTWVVEPQDVSALLGAPASLHCAARGNPQPTVTWLKGQGTTEADFRAVSETGGGGVALGGLVSANGTLQVLATAAHNEGVYLCRATNGVGRGLAKLVRLAVHEPAHFEEGGAGAGARRVSARRGQPTTLSCDARGDLPIRAIWTHDDKPLDLNTYRLSVSEVVGTRGLRSQLNLARTERRDSGAYRCRADNAYGRADLLIHLAVQERPDAPAGLRALEVSARGVRLSWRRAFDGHAPLTGYRLQRDRLGTRDDVNVGVVVGSGREWNDRTIDLPLHDVRQFGSDPEELEVTISGLRPATAYTVRLAAVNEIDQSDFSEPVVVKTQEEAPTEPPHNVQVHPGGPGELLVTWKPPPSESWNGDLLGYLVSWSEEGESAAPSPAPPRSVSVSGRAASETSLSGLRKFARYEVRVRAFNALAAGPPSLPVHATTPEGVPEAPPGRVRCEPLSSQSARVRWEPPPPHLQGGPLQGYEILLEPLPAHDEWWFGDMVSGAGAETKHAAGTDAVLHALHRATNYSVSVRARNNAGAGLASLPVYCHTSEDVPGAPEDIKALAYSVESVLVSWLPPLMPNGRVRHYTLYSREAGRVGKQSQQMVKGVGGSGGLSLELRSLEEHRLYEFWVTASTAEGEGEPSAVVAQGPSSRGPARIASFGRRVRLPAGGTARLRCGVAPSSAPRPQWTRALAALPLKDARYHLDDVGHLTIHNVEQSMSGNYTCTVRNAYGSDSATYSLHVLLPPARPALRLRAAHAARLQLAWDEPPNGGAPIIGYNLEWSRVGDPWRTVRLAADARTHSLDALACGAPYRSQLTAINAVGASAPSVTLSVHTKGGLSKIPPEKDLIATNSTYLRLNLLTWDDGGCPVRAFSVSWRAFSEVRWREARARRADAADGWATSGLTPATWYHLKVVATNEPGTTTATYYFSTLTENGERIPPPATWPPAEGSAGLSGMAVPSAALALGLAATAAALLSGLLYRRVRNKSTWQCLSKGYQQSGMSEEDEKNVERRDNHRNCQQVYTSSPGKHPNGKHEHDHQEMYEISPYATFSMAGGVGGVGSGAGAGSGAVAGATSGSAASVHFRTFGRDDPPAAVRARHTKQRSLNNAEEYTLSRSATLAARSEESGSESSGSACAECGPGAYRVPHAHAHSHHHSSSDKETFRPITDSSAESALESGGGVVGAVVGGLAGGVVGGVTGGIAGAGGKRRRGRGTRGERNHHTPTAVRYPPREQERRDFTIHV